jgi:hypothetical membrane protein
MLLRRSLAHASTWGRLVLAGILIYVAIDVALIFLRSHFSVLHNAESDYGSKGHYAWLMDLNFLLRAAFSLAAVRALWLSIGENRHVRVGLTLVGLWAVCSGALAFFPDDPVGTPTHGSGRVHGVLAALAFVAVLVGTIEISLALRRLSYWQPIRRTLVIVSFGALIPLLLLGHVHFGRHTLGGLYEKLFLAIELLWLAIAAAFAGRVEPPAAVP